MMRKPTVPKVPLSKRTQQQPSNKPTNMTNKISKSKSATKPVVVTKTNPKPKAETAKSACELRPESSPSEDTMIIDENNPAAFQPIESPVNDAHQPNRDKLRKAGDHLTSAYPSSTQEHMYIRNKLLEDLETERLARKRLESDSQRLQSQIQTLQLRMDRQQAAVNNRSSPRPATQPTNAQKQQLRPRSFGNRKTLLHAGKIVESPADVQMEETEEPGETVESLRAELDDRTSTIRELENDSRLLESRCLALESEVADLKSALNHMRVRTETLDRENADLKLELDNEMQLHSTEIAKLSDQAFISSEKLEKLENDNAKLVRELAESAKARSKEAETWAKKLQETMTTENEAMYARTGQHDIITQHLKDIQRKENFIATLKSENECLCRKNKALELKIEQLEREEKTGAFQPRGGGGGGGGGPFAGDEHASCRKQFERLKAEVEDTKESFRNLWTIHDRETLALKRTNREKEDEYRHYVNEQSKRFSEEMEKMRKMIDQKANLPQNEKESTNQIGYNRDKNNKYNSRSADNVYSEEDDDEKFLAVSYIGD